MIALDLAGVQVSAGAACSSGKVARSHVLDAMGAGATRGRGDPGVAALVRRSGGGRRVPDRLPGDGGAAFCAAPPDPTSAPCRPAPNRPVYLDNQATTPCDPRVLAAMLPWFTEHFGNPHSAEHAMGRQADTAVEQARGQVAALIGAEAREMVFTSGATESNNIAIKGAARHAAADGDPRRRVVTLATEHKCVLESVADLRAEGFEPVVLPVRPDGLLDPELLAAALAAPTLLVSVMAVNNETGVVQDLAATGRARPRHGALFHTDAAQGSAKSSWMSPRSASICCRSAATNLRPERVGALYVRRRPRVRLAPLFSGGGQERGLRAGTLPAPLIVGLGEAARLAGPEMTAEAARLALLRDTTAAAGCKRPCRGWW